MIKKLRERSKQKSDARTEAIIKNHDQISKALEVLFATEYVDQKKLYMHNFLRGMAFSAGGVIGATVVISLLVWLLSLFNTVPLVGPFFDDVRQSVENSNPNP